MTQSHHEIIRRHSRPLLPQATALQPRPALLKGLRAVLFDVYGTMLVSASGDVGTGAASGRQQAMAGALEAVSLLDQLNAAETLDCFQRAIEARHHELRDEGIDYPEIDIVAIWQVVVNSLVPSGSEGKARRVDCQRLALEYEMRVNPVWPMPGLNECLERLRGARVELGIVSNAQFYTRELFPALLGSAVEEMGFDSELQYYSYAYGRAKPGLFLYEQARDCLARRGTKPDQVLYVGNDMLNDILPATKCGFRTALFAGDARSLRLRDRDSRVADITPDIIATDLAQLGIV